MAIRCGFVSNPRSVVAQSKSSEPAPGHGTSLYVHVPFCVVKCGYCDFNSYVLTDAASHELFLEALAAELAVTPVPAHPVSVFIGGGTPSLLDADRLGRLFAILGQHVDLAHCPEVTMEANPESVTLQKAEVALAAGVRRTSIGVQSFRAERLAQLDRAHDGDRARAAFADLRRAGFANINVDLMFGLPGQQEQEWQQDLDAVLELNPDHLSCYNLTFEPGTRFHHELEHGRMARNDEAADTAMFTATRARLARAGFQAYEISNFAGRGGPCRHNDHYWLQGDYIGVGPGASSHRSGVRSTNIKALEPWARTSLAGQRPAATAETLTPRQRAGEAVWLGLRRSQGVDLAAIAQRCGLDVERLFARELATHLSTGGIVRQGTRIVLTDPGILLADRIAGDFLAPGD